MLGGFLILGEGVSFPLNPFPLEDFMIWTELRINHYYMGNEYISYSVFRKERDSEIWASTYNDNGCVSYICENGLLLGYDNNVNYIYKNERDAIKAAQLHENFIKIVLGNITRMLR